MPSTRNASTGASRGYLNGNVARECGLDELHLSVERDNEPSIKTIKKNGGIFERSFEFENEPADVYRIAL